jgi:hypothetical protein
LGQLDLLAWDYPDQLLGWCSDHSIFLHMPQHRWLPRLQPLLLMKMVQINHKQVTKGYLPKPVLVRKQLR